MYDVEGLSRFCEIMSELRDKYPRAQRAVDAVTAILRIRPWQVFTSIVIGREDWRVFKLNAAPGVPAMNVYYRIDEEQQKVYLIRADLCEVGDSDEDES